MVIYNRPKPGKVTSLPFPASEFARKRSETVRHVGTRQHTTTPVTIAFGEGVFTRVVPPMVRGTVESALYEAPVPLSSTEGAITAQLVDGSGTPVSNVVDINGVTGAAFDIVGPFNDGLRLRVYCDDPSVCPHTTSTLAVVYFSR
jgi:hypothetical protein